LKQDQVPTVPFLHHAQWACLNVLQPR
jgi:hypothetical protein